MINLENAIRDNVVGYCDATRLTFEPKAEHFAVMVEFESEQFWCHIPCKDCYV